MKNVNAFKSLFIVTYILMNITVFSQTKKEKKVEAISVDMGMYKTPESELAMKYYEQALDHHSKDDLKGAIKLYKKAVKEEPQFAEAYDNMGVCYRRLGDFKNAISNYEKSIEIYPEGVMAHLNLGIIYGIQKDYSSALAEYKTVQDLESDNPEGYYGTIDIYLNKGDYKLAIENSIKTLEIYEATESPHLPEAQYLLGLSYYYDNDKVKAKVYMEQAKKSGIDIPAKLTEELGL